MEDTEKTIAELKARIDKTITYVKSVSADKIVGREDDMIPLPKFFGDKKMTGYDYAISYTMPNFYFHVTTAYSILRMNGVALGKGDFTGQLDMQ